MEYANSVDLDQTAPSVWSGSKLFAIPLSILQNNHIKNKIYGQIKTWNNDTPLLSLHWEITRSKIDKMFSINNPRSDLHNINTHII